MGTAIKRALQVGVAWLALGAAPALTADLAARPYTKAPAMIATIYDWSGFYIGANAGGGSAHKCWTNTSTFGTPTVPNAAEGCHDATGALVGGQIGYRWQTGAWVFGVEAQGDWADFKGSNASQFIPGATNQSKIDALGLFTGQIGYSWNNVLWYVKGGGAVANDKYNGITTAAGSVFDQGSETRWGGVVGTGIEVGFAPNWSVAAEYDHLFMGSRALTFSTVPTGTISRTDTVGQGADMATVRVNYRWGGPVVGKY
ncbi:outer membrane protein [Bradyrhizobium sp. STM 3557]|uniref:outer membrane protein n=1 Tax=Bradyrhizobium sp. STM 3557 TaxID=578920 RepID=UPI00388EED32